MKFALKHTALICALLIFGVAAANADEYSYTLTEQGDSTPLATWTMSSTPAPNCPSQGLVPCYALDEYFGLDTDVYLNGSTTATPDTLIFFNLGFTENVAFNDTGTGPADLMPFLPELTTVASTLCSGDTGQLYSGSESDPTMVLPSSGCFVFASDTPQYSGDLFVLSVVDETTTGVPEPSTCLLLLMGLGSVLIIGRKRRFGRGLHGELPAIP